MTVLDLGSRLHGGGGSTIAKHRSPLLVAALGILTGGIFVLYWIHRVTREAAGFDPDAEEAVSPTKWGVPLGIVAFVVGTAAGVALIAMARGLAPGTVPSEGELVGILGVMALASLIATIAAVGLLLALWRLWGFVERHERRLASGAALSPGLMLGLVLGPIAVSIVPFAGFLGVLVAPFGAGYVLHRTQRGLNRIWLAARRGYQASPDPAPVGAASKTPGTSSVEFSQVAEPAIPEETSEDADAGRG